jgi:integrase
MPRTAKGPRLYWRKDKEVWLIRDTGRGDSSTGTRDREEAEKKLSAYLASKDTVVGTQRADQIAIEEILDIYGREHAPSVAAPERIGYAIDALVPFWGLLTVAHVKGETCRRYCKTRQRAFKNGDIAPIGNGTLRRELNVLQAAINYCFREGYLLTPTKVTLPPKPPSRDRCLTRDEAADVIWTAYRDKKRKHIARFMLVALYTGTRKDAILKMGFNPSVTSGWVDVDRGLMFRRGSIERETNKRRKPVRLTRRLLAHCRRWKAMGANWVVEIDGQRVGDIKKSFASICKKVGLSDVTPHTTKHSAITWAVQRGLTMEDAADYFDTSVETIQRTYYHHSPHYQDRALEILERKL